MVVDRGLLARGISPDGQEHLSSRKNHGVTSVGLQQGPPARAGPVLPAASPHRESLYIWRQTVYCDLPVHTARKNLAHLPRAGLTINPRRRGSTCEKKKKSFHAYSPCNAPTPIAFFSFRSLFPPAATFVAKIRRVLGPDRRALASESGGECGRSHARTSFGHRPATSWRLCEEKNFGMVDLGQ